MREGRIFKLGDHIDTDALAPGAYMKRPLGVLAEHCLETIRPDFAAGARPGDVIIAGRNFGMGSSREQAADVLKHLGVAAVCAISFGGIFYRNALNLGLPVYMLDETVIDEFIDGQRVAFDLAANTLRCEAGSIPLPMLPEFLRRMVQDGGLVPHLEKRFKNQAGPAGK